MPQMVPMITDPKGETMSQPAVMPTNPARMPFSVRDKEGLPYFIQLTANAKKPPAQAARFVVRKTCEIAIASSVEAAANCEPGLNPNQPNHKDEYTQCRNREVMSRNGS